MKDLVTYFGSCTVTHNGMKVEFFSNGSDVLSYIANILGRYQNLNPQLIIDAQVGDNLIIVYQYKTMYKEMFLIEFDS